MKHFVHLLLLLCPIIIYSQDTTLLSENDPFYDYKELQLSNTATIPGFDSKKQKLKVTGTIYQSDGVTPAEGVILYIEQPDEDGDFNVIKEEDKKYVQNRGWIKTDANGQYTFFTYVPGSDRRYNRMQQLYPIVKESTKPGYAMATFLFDEDPLLTKRCRKRMAKKGDPSRILKLKTVDGLLVAQKDIVLQENPVTTK
ncbi:hypothetical protein [Winogradskyella sp. 3972H.M.0a.05]|uniref:hypothetical protein n=1 Tax=Winogradskyella sp. 3972H.M.0a.05 TaxID=2950277 RepID=UPI003394DE1F